MTANVHRLHGLDKLSGWHFISSTADQSTILHRAKRKCNHHLYCGVAMALM